jgi:hypothetical protein
MRQTLDTIFSVEAAGVGNWSQSPVSQRLSRGSSCPRLLLPPLPVRLAPPPPSPWNRSSAARCRSQLALYQPVRDSLVLVLRALDEESPPRLAAQRSRYVWIPFSTRCDEGYADKPRGPCRCRSSMPNRWKSSRRHSTSLTPTGMVCAACRIQ